MMTNNRAITEEFDDQKISMALMAPFVILTLQYLILIYFNLLGSSGASIVQLLSKCLVGLAFLYALPSVLRRSKVKFIVVFFGLVFVFLVNYLIFPKNHLYLTELLLPVLSMSFPAFVYSLSLRNWDVLKQTMKKASLIVFAFGTVLGGLIFSGKSSIGVYSMSLSYYMLLPTLIFLDELLEKFSLKSFLFVLVSFTIILALGSRGAILCIFVFIILKLIRFNSKLTYKKVSYYLIILGMVTITLLNLEGILRTAEKFLMEFGIKSRSIQLLLDQDISLSGRENIYQSLVREISENPFLGLGLGADRGFTDTGYAHNFFIEVLANFGVLFGSIFLIMLMLIVLKSLLTRDKEKYSMFIIWLGLGFIHLMVSSSYWLDIKFWILMGLIVGNLINRDVKYRIRSKRERNIVTCKTAKL